MARSCHSMAKLCHLMAKSCHAMANFCHNVSTSGQSKNRCLSCLSLGLFQRLGFSYVVLWTGEWGQGNGRIFGLSVRDLIHLILYLVPPSGVATWAPLKTRGELLIGRRRSAHYIHSLVWGKPPSAFGPQAEKPVLPCVPFPCSPQSNLGPFPCPQSLVQERVCSGPKNAISVGWGTMDIRLPLFILYAGLLSIQPTPRRRRAWRWRL